MGEWLKIRMEKLMSRVENRPPLPHLSPCQIYPKIKKSLILHFIDIGVVNLVAETNRGRFERILVRQVHLHFPFSLQ